MHEPRRAIDCEIAPSDLVMQLMLRSHLGWSSPRECQALHWWKRLFIASWRTCWHLRMVPSEPGRPCSVLRLKGFLPNCSEVGRPWQPPSRKRKRCSSTSSERVQKHQNCIHLETNTHGLIHLQSILRALPRWGISPPSSVPRQAGQR
jgi:hypothetical protein